MGARQKLNRSYANGSVFLAAVAGWFTSSWLVFCVALGVLLAVNVHHGEIRIKKLHK